MPLHADKQDGKVCNDAGVLKRSFSRVIRDWTPRAASTRGLSHR
jgi:hypothetical protein